eukprot:gb/GFBE01046793.1/.p1 GENE.gb/GFBE01046793.1/~~gb/GFBE01046793.1/.p1  ORF type:complete len:612 (+),score=57.53 gb/GFBE01046793.1/:1-1836(+)
MIWRSIPAHNLLWVAAPEDSTEAVAAAASQAGVHVARKLPLEKLESASCLLLDIPFFSREQLGVSHQHGPLGLDSIVTFNEYLRSVFEEEDFSFRDAQPLAVCLYCTRRAGAVANSLLLLGAYLMLEKNVPASDVVQWLLLSDDQGGVVPLYDQSFPTPFRSQTKLTNDSLTLQDCFFGLASAVQHGWLDYFTLDMPSRRQIAMAFDTVPVFELVLLGLDDVQSRVQFWVAADPVTTVVDPTARPDPPPEGNESSFGFSISSSASGSGMGSGMEGVHSIVLGGQSYAGAYASESSQITTLHKPESEWLARSGAVATTSNSMTKKIRRRLRKMSGKLSRIPFKVHAAANSEVCRPEDLPAFARWLRSSLRCQLLVRANFPTEPGLPGGDSYSDFFQRWGIEQLDLNFADGTAPSFNKALTLVSQVDRMLQHVLAHPQELGTSHSVVVHCKSGLGRSMSLLGALAVAFTPGLHGGDFFGWCRLVRPGAIQTADQERFLRSLDEEPSESCDCFVGCLGRRRRISRRSQSFQAVVQPQHTPTHSFPKNVVEAEQIGSHERTSSSSSELLILTPRSSEIHQISPRYIAPQPQPQATPPRRIAGEGSGQGSEELIRV